MALLLFRLLWGFVGPGHARFADFMRSPREVLGHLKAMLRLREPRYLGHNPAGGAMALALLALIAVTAGLGLVLYGVDEGRGPLAALAGGLSESGDTDVLAGSANRSLSCGSGILAATFGRRGAGSRRARTVAG